MPPEKQERIRNAAFREFAEHGFEQASTNRIVKEAGIGKGMLFYYFASKKELFYYLIGYGVNFVRREYLDKLDVNERDFIKKCKQAVQAKMAAIAKNQYVFTFLGALYLEQASLPPELAAMLREEMRAARVKLYANIDLSLFREDVAPEITIKLIKWSIDGIEKEIVDGLQGKKLTAIDLRSYDLSQFNSYLAVLKKIFYK